MTCPQVLVTGSALVGVGWGQSSQRESQLSIFLCLKGKKKLSQSTDHCQLVRYLGLPRRCEGEQRSEETEMLIGQNILLFSQENA